MTSKENSLNWFEIPAKDLTRAKKFYETIFGINMDGREAMERQMAFFPAEEKSGKASGCLVQSPLHNPSAEGTVVYLNANPDLSKALSLVEKTGGTIRMPKTKISDENGYIAVFRDSEGNTVALHSNN